MEVETECGPSHLVHNDDYPAEVEEYLSSRLVQDIAEETGLHPAHVELYQTMFCSVDLCEYGTSPRGCWPRELKQFARFLTLWKMNLAGACAVPDAAAISS